MLVSWRMTTMMSVMMRGCRGRTHTAAYSGEEVHLGIGDASRETVSETFQLPPTGAQPRLPRRGETRTADALSGASAGTTPLPRQGTGSPHRKMAVGSGSRCSPRTASPPDCCAGRSESRSHSACPMARAPPRQVAARNYQSPAGTRQS